MVPATSDCPASLRPDHHENKKKHVLVMPNALTSLYGIKARFLRRLLRHVWEAEGVSLLFLDSIFLLKILTTSTRRHRPSIVRTAPQLMTVNDGRLRRLRVAAGITEKDADPWSRCRGPGGGVAARGRGMQLRNYIRRIQLEKSVGESSVGEVCTKVERTTCCFACADVVVVPAAAAPCVSVCFVFYALFCASRVV